MTDTHPTRRGSAPGPRASARTRRAGHALAMLLLPSLVLAQASSPFLTGANALQTNILILRSSASEQGGTAQFASRLIGEREVLRRQRSRGRDRGGWPAAAGARRSLSVSDACITEQAVLPAQIEQLPDLTGYLKTAHRRAWLRVRFRRT